MFPFNPNLNFKKFKIAKLKISKYKKWWNPLNGIKVIFKCIRQSNFFYKNWNTVKVGIFNKNSYFRELNTAWKQRRQIHIVAQYRNI